MKKLKLTKKLKEEFYDTAREALKGKMPPHIIKKMISTDTFPEYAPYYERLIIDSYGNILVFYNNCYSKPESRRFQVYSPDGKYFCESKISFGQYKSTSRIPLIFHNENLYCLAELKNSDDNLLQIIKVNLR